MGFLREHAIQALYANAGNEEAALNALLAGPSTPAEETLTSDAPSMQQKPKSGFLGKFWSKM